MPQKFIVPSKGRRSPVKHSKTRGPQHQRLITTSHIGHGKRLITTPNYSAESCTVSAK